MSKKTAAEIGYGYFDRHDMQLLNDYNFFIYFILIFVFLFCDCKFFGSCNIPLEKSWNFNVWV